MNQTDFRKQREAEFTAKHELTQDELEKLIEDKFKRAAALYTALQKREDIFVEYD